MERDIRVKLAGDLNLPHLPIWVGHFREAIAAQYSREPFTLTVDLSETAFVSASSAASLASLLTWLRAGSCVQGRFLRPTNRDVDHWLSRMDFYEIVGAKVSYPFHRWPDGGRLQEVTQLTDEPQVDVVTQRIAEILSGKTELDRGVVKNLQTLTAELIENVFHHAQSNVGAFVCAQCYPQRRMVEVGIADCGRGISASLKGNPELNGDSSRALTSNNRAPERKFGLGTVVGKRIRAGERGPHVRALGRGNAADRVLR